MIRHGIFRPFSLDGIEKFFPDSMTIGLGKIVSPFPYISRYFSAPTLHDFSVTSLPINYQRPYLPPSRAALEHRRQRRIETFSELALGLWPELGDINGKIASKVHYVLRIRRIGPTLLQMLYKMENLYSIEQHLRT